MKDQRPGKFISIKIILPAIILLYVIFSALFFYRFWINSHHDTSQKALQATYTMAIGIDGEMFTKLRGIPEDVGTVHFESVKKRLMHLLTVYPDVKFIYLYIEKEGKLIFTVDSEPPESKDYTPPGTEYTEADPEYFRPFKEGKAIITKPVTDRWGTWVSILVPIKDKKTKQVKAVLGVDYPASKWMNEAIKHTVQLFIILLVFFLLLITIFRLVVSIHARKTKETMLQQKEQSYRELFDGNRDGLVMVDMEGSFLDVNPAFCQMLGYSLAELKELEDFFKITPKRWWEFEREEILKNRLLKQGYSGVYEKEYIRKDGTIFPVELQAYAIQDGDGNINSLWAVARDITERKKMEQHTLKSQRLESIGILAGGIAHDFNNLLGGIFGYIELARKNVNENKYDNVLKYLSKLMTMFYRAKDLSQQLLTFSKGGHPVSKNQSLIPILKHSSEFSLSGSNVKRNISVPDDLWDVCVDENQIGQVIDNIVINAKQAMPDGGEITVMARNVPHGETLPLGLKARPYVCFSIADNGIGISAENLTKIFDPFFTTKPKGSGLGLATVYSIIKRHEGEIEVKSQPNLGTTFIIYLPASTKREKSEPNIMNEEFKYRGNVLIMDDEEDLLDLFSCNLEEIGCTVTCARNGEEAVELFSKAKVKLQPFTLVILDLTIPGGIGGKEVIKHLRKIDESFIAIVSSGYSEDTVMAKPLEHGFNDAIAKPYNRKDLVEVLMRNRLK